MEFQNNSNCQDFLQIKPYSKSLSQNIVKCVVKLAEISDLINDLGLYNGKTGILLLLHQVIGFLNGKEKEIVRRAIDLMQEDISEKACYTDDSFSNGLFGIGWGVCLLYEEGYLVENEQEVMNSFDDQLYKLMVNKKVVNQGLENGTMGRIAYFLRRVSGEIMSYNKYRYVCNQVCLKLLVSDFNNENEKILDYLESENGYLLLTSEGKYYSAIFNLLSTLANNRINFETVEQQKLRFFRIFYKYFEYLKSQDEFICNDTEIYWNTIPILNCILTFASNSRILQERLTANKSLFDKITLHYQPFGDVKDLISLVSFLELNNYSIPETQLQKKIFEYNERTIGGNCGLHGISGLLCLITSVKNKRSNFVKSAFLM